MTIRHLTSYLADTAAMHPDRVAVVDASGLRATYAELNRRSNALAAQLAGRGVGPGDRVAVVLPKSIASLVSFFAVLKTGAAYVPVDASAPPDRSRRILSDCAATALIIHADVQKNWPECLEPHPRFKALVIEGTDCLNSDATVLSFEEAVRMDQEPPPTEGDLDDLAYIIYTSGSTGTPKGAMMTHRNAIAYIEWCSTFLAATSLDQFSSQPPFHFDASVQDIYVTVKHGATVHLISDDLGKRPRDLARFIEERKISICFSTPSALTVLLHFGDLGSHDMSSLRMVMFGGEVFPVKHLRALKEHWRCSALLRRPSRKRATMTRTPTL